MFEGPAESTRRKVRLDGVRVLLALVLLLGLYARLANLGGVFAAGRVFLGPDDAYFHMRRIRATMAAFPRVPTYDAYTNFPEGATLDWPVGFDLGMAALGKLAQAVSADPRAVEAVAALAVPVLGVLVCLLVYFLGRRLGGRGVGVVSALLAAVIPILTGYSIVGRVDHHVVEPLLILGPLLLLLRSLDAARGRAGAALAAATGALLALDIAFWPGALVAGLLAFLSLAALLARAWRDEALRSRLVWRPTWIFGVATAVALPVSLLHPWARQGSFAYYAPSWLQPACFALASLGFASLGLLRRRVRSPGRALGLLLGAPLVLGVALLALPAVREAAASALGYLARRETQISLVEESRPLLARGAAFLGEQYTLLAWLAPLALLHALWRARHRAGHGSAAALVFAAWLLGALPFGLAQVRLGSVLAPLLCVAWAVAAADLHGLLRRRHPGPWAPRLILGTAGVLLLLPTMALHRPARFSGPRELIDSLDALFWLDQRAAGDTLRFAERPRFGTMSRWEWGHFLTYFSGQANIASPLGQTAQNQLGVRRSAAFYLSSDPEAAVRQLEDLRVRYVLVSPLLDDLPRLIQHTGRELAALMAPAPGGTIEVKPGYFLLMNSRLLHFDGRRFGLQGRPHGPLRRLRLVFESRAQIVELGRPLSYCKVFELVRGATLSGRAAPSAVVELALEVVTSRGRAFLYADQTRADAEGRFRFLVPYSTSGDHLYRIAAADAAPFRAAVSDEDVLQGRLIQLQGASGAAPTVRAR